MDHNTRTTTWQRPTTESMANYANFNEWRGGRTLEQFGQRFLYPQQQQQQTPAAQEADPLGPLPEGWGEQILFLNTF